MTAPDPIDVAAVELCGIHTEPCHIIQWQVNTQLFAVDRDVLQKIDQLERRADGIGLDNVGRGGRAVEREHQQADRIGRPAAIVQQGGKIRVLFGDHVLLEGRQQVKEGLERQTILSDCCRQTVE